MSGNRASGAAATGVVDNDEHERFRRPAEPRIQAEERPRTRSGRGRDPDAGQQALASTSLISDDALRSIEAMIAAIDAKLTEQVNAIMHHEDFQQLESAWRGLNYLVNNTETDETLKIRVLNISKKELARR